MRERILSLGTLVIVIALVPLVPVPIAGQTQVGDGNALRTPWGDPDLQGTWTNATATPLHRPTELAGQSVLTDEERADLDARREQNRDRPPPPGSPGAYNSVWTDQGTWSAQTSLIVDPPDGRLPALTEHARLRDAAFAAGWDAPDSFEDLNLFDRCITRGLPGAMIPGFYNHNYQILQTPDYIVILVEMIHDVRIIPLDGRSRLPSSLRQWLGDSRAHWDSETLVVETTNFSPKVDQRAIRTGPRLVLSGSEHSHFVERFRRVDADTIDYRFTLTDPTTYTKPWTASIPMSRLEAAIFEYACHEGNYGMLNILRGARTQERVVAETPSSR